MKFETHFKAYLKKKFSKAKEPAEKLLQGSVLYSLLGKASRFRPQLCFATAKALNQQPKKILPWAMAIEMIHTASLIHDDMPSMDDSKTRRGKKCTHLVYGEGIALLAGDCLFIESFSLLNDPLFNKHRLELFNLLISKLGFRGLMSGQALDLHFGSFSKAKLFKMMQLKTGSLIEAAVIGPTILWGKTEKEKKALKNYSRLLGPAYQLADDLKDKDGLIKAKKQTEKELHSITKKALNALKPLGEKADELRKLAVFNQQAR